MRLLSIGLVVVVVMGVAACSAGPGQGVTAGIKQSPVASTESKAQVPAPVPASPVTSAPLQAPRLEDEPFTGVWEECDEGTSPDECSRYVLVQRGRRICGTWSYLATADLYEGRLQATALSGTQARRTQVCGRPGSEARTECDAGWDAIDKPLRVCGETLGTFESPDACPGRYVRSRAAIARIAELSAEPWMQACLAGASGVEKAATK